MRLGRLIRWLAVGFVVVAVGLGILVGDLVLFASRPAVSGSQERVILEIPKGMLPSKVSDLLESRGVITSALKLYRVGQWTRRWDNMKAGEYEFSPSMTPLQVLGVLTSGISVAHPVTIPPGKNMYQVAELVEQAGLATKADMLALFRDREFIASLGLNPLPRTLEGYLYPDTYNFNKTMTTRDMARAMVKRFEKEWATIKDTPSPFSSWTQLQILTLASIIEKETGAPWERPQISSVFHNRLRKKMKLQSDPTTIYGMWERYTGNIHKSDLLEATPFNTYAIPALPVGPISNPGREAILAALQPAQSEHLFFVSKNDGTHEFTSNVRDHNAAVKKFQLDRKAREGKSWRDLTKPKTSQR